MVRKVIACSRPVFFLLFVLFACRALGQSPSGAGVKFHVHSTQQPGTVRLYRLYLEHTGHTYTTSEAEVRTMTKSRKYQARIEPMDMFVYTEQKPGTVRLYRFIQKLDDGGWRSFYTAFEPEMKEVRRRRHCELHAMEAYVFPHDYRPTELVLQEGRPTTPDVQDVTLSRDPQHPSRGADTIISNNYDGITLIRFDVSRVPSDARIRSATLELCCTSVGFSQEETQRTCELKLFRFGHDWKEGSGSEQLARQDGANVATFDGQSPWPDGGAKACAGELLDSFAHKGDYRDWCRWNVKPHVVQEWRSPAKRNYGLMIQGTPRAKALCYASSDAPESQNRPILRLALSYADDIVPVYHCYNPVSSEHFYTTSEEERDAFLDNAKQAVTAKKKRDEERHKQAAQQKLAEASKTKPAEKSVPKTGAEKLALLHLGRAVGRDDPVVRRFDGLIRKIQAKCVPIDDHHVAAVTNMARTLLKDRGVTIDLLELLEWLERSAPERDVAPYKYEDVALAFVCIAGSDELTEDELPKAHAYVRATLEALAGK